VSASASSTARVSARGAVALIVLAELFGTSLWFSANAVADALNAAWGLTTVQLGHLTSAVQLGFISGTLLFALSGLADRFSASRIFAVCAIVGAALNAAFAMAGDSLLSALMLRFLTGVTLAGVYPVGMKLVVSWAPESAGRVLGWLVGMLTFGTGLPHLVRGSGMTPTWQGVIYAASALATAAAILVLWLGDGPHHANTRNMQWGRVLETYRVPAFRSAAFGYFGHMWELYAFWAMVPLLIAQIAVGQSTNQIYAAAFFVFAAGGLGCIGGGLVSQRVGSARVAIVALTGSALSCLLYPLVQGMAYTVALALLLAWGLFVVADSPQFSALASRACPKDRIGSALALMNSIGFAITIVAIQIVAASWENLGERIAWLLLPGPVIGIIMMRRLWRPGT